MNKYSKQIYNQYQDAMRRRKSKILSICFYITGFFGVLAGATYLLYRNSESYKVHFIVFVGFFGIFLIVLLMLWLFFVSEKPLYEILYPKVVNDHNFEESTFITYTPYPDEKDLFTFGGLYPKFAIKSLRFKLSFANRQGFPVDVYDAYVATTSGKTTNILLNGYYLLFRDYSDLKFQLRTHGAPNVDPKYKKLPDITDVNAFVEPSAEELDDKYIKLYHLIKNEYHSPSVTMGCNGSDLHIGITLRPMRRHVRVLSEHVYQEIRGSLMQMIDLANIIK